MPGTGREVSSSGKASCSYSPGSGKNGGRVCGSLHTIQALGGTHRSWCRLDGSVGEVERGCRSATRTHPYPRALREPGSLEPGSAGRDSGMSDPPGSRKGASAQGLMPEQGNGGERKVQVPDLSSPRLPPERRPGSPESASAGWVTGSLGELPDTPMSQVRTPRPTPPALT